MTGAASWLGWALLSAVFAAFTAIFGKLGVRDVDSDLATLVRTLCVIPFLGALVWVKGGIGDPLAWSGRTWLFLSLSGLATGASWLCYYRTLQLGEASSVVPVEKLSLVLTVLLAVIFLGERPAAREWFGIAMVAGGALLLAWRR